MQSSDADTPSRGRLFETSSPEAALIAAVTSSPKPTIAWGCSALAVHGLGDHPTVPRVASSFRLRRPDIYSSWVHDLDELGATMLLGIAVATLPIAVASTAATFEFAEFDRLVARTLRRKLATWTSLEVAFLQLNDRGRAGTMLRNSIMTDHDNAERRRRSTHLRSATPNAFTRLTASRSTQASPPGSGITLGSILNGGRQCVEKQDQP